MSPGAWAGLPAERPLVRLCRSSAASGRWRQVGGAAGNGHVLAFAWTEVFRPAEQTPRSAAAGSRGEPLFSSARTCQTVFQNSCAGPGPAGGAGSSAGASLAARAHPAVSVRPSPLATGGAGGPGRVFPVRRRLPSSRAASSARSLPCRRGFSVSVHRGDTPRIGRVSARGCFSASSQSLSQSRNVSFS